MLSRRSFLRRLSTGLLALPAAVLLPEAVSVIDYDAPLIAADYERIDALVGEYGAVPTFETAVTDGRERVAR